MTDRAPRSEQDPSARHRVLLVDDHAVLRAGVRRLLEDESDLEVVGEAADGIEAVEAGARLRPDVAVVDLTLPRLDGVEATRRILQRSPDTRVLVLTMHDEPAFVERVIEAGASGYVLKRAADSDLIRAIRAVCSGEGFLDPGVARSVFEFSHMPERDSATKRLSPREREVLALVAWGHTNREIADRLVVSQKTIESHKARLMDKLGLRTRAELVRHAKKSGLLDSAPPMGDQP